MMRRNPVNAPIASATESPPRSVAAGASMRTVYRSTTRRPTRIRPGGRAASTHTSGDIVLADSSNFNGGPTRPKFRRTAFDVEEGGLSSLFVHRYHCLVEPSLWLRLLAHGDAVYTPGRLSALRIQHRQEQDETEVWTRCRTERVERISEAPRLG